MKRLSLLLCLVMILSLLCPMGALGTEEVPVENTCDAHRAVCTNPGVCVNCGYEGEMETSHTGGKVGKVNDETTHLVVCAGCGEVLDTGNHYAYECTSPCEKCGYDGTFERSGHAGDSKCVANGDKHDYVCTACGEVMESYPHSTTCKDPTHCQQCDYTGEITYIYHDSEETVIDDAGHMVRCADCHKVIEEEEPHTATCDQPDVCRDCGYEGEIEDVQHGAFNVRSIDQNVHAEFCEVCGEKRFQTMHCASCHEPNVCAQCGYVGEMSAWHLEMKYVDCGDTHQQVCRNCGTLFDESEHYAECTNPNVCARCGHEGEMEILEHEEMVCTFTDEEHTMKCPSCGEIIFKEAHSALCNTPNECSYCDYKGEIKRIEHSYGEYTHTDEKHISACRYCGETEEERHEALCSAPDVCVVCGYEGDIAFMQHADGGYTDVGDVHRFECSACGDSWDGEHWAFCGDRVCILCGSEKLSYTQHIWEENEKNHNPETHELTCAGCGELFTSYSEFDIVDPTCTTDGLCTFTCAFCRQSGSKVLPALGHEWGEATEVKATCETDGSSEKTCKTCGATEKTVLPALGHTWSEIARVNATCTTGGSATFQCGRCGEQSVQKLGALGHDFGIVYTSQNDGTHAVFCSRCNEKHAVKCAMASTKIGDMICSACPICGYTEYTMKESALETLPGMDGVAVNTRLERVENVKFEPVRTANGAEAPAMSENLLLVVHRIALELQTELPDFVQASVREVLAVALLNGEESVQPEGMIRLSIPCGEEQLEGLKLMFLTEEGELIEIEYEIIDGEIVFETDQIGVFLMVEDTAEEI